MRTTVRNQVDKRSLADKNKYGRSYVYIGDPMSPYLPHVEAQAVGAYAPPTEQQLEAARAVVARFAARWHRPVEFGLRYMTDAGMSVAMVDTGGDPGHLPARRTHESLGFCALPVVRYFKKL
jgi:hypothetical protein